jgi:hypothetical protein
MQLVTIDKPGIYELPAAAYHADPCPAPSLSSSIAKQLCLASPVHAWQAHPRLNPAAEHENGEHFDIGTAAHALLLEGTSTVSVIAARDYRTKAAQEARDAAYAAGRTPILEAKWADVQAMVASARVQLAAHKDGGAEMFTNGKPEQTLIWQEGDVWCRARLDWLRTGAIDDYKTTPYGSANPDSWTRSMFSMGADIQVAFYLRGLRALAQTDVVLDAVIGADATFRFCVQEPYPPYALSVVGLGPDALTLAEKKVLYAIERWQVCLEAGEWPGYPRRTCYASLPAWQESWWLEREMR